MDEFAENPFAALFSSVTEAQAFAVTTQKGIDKHGIDDEISAKALEKLDLNQLIEQVFLITLDREPSSLAGRPPKCVYLKELHEASNDQDWIDHDNLEQALFERLMLGNPLSMVITTHTSAFNKREASAVVEDKVLFYLYQCYIRCSQVKDDVQEHVSRFKKILVSNAQTALQNPDIYPGQTLSSQFLDIFFQECHSSESDLMIEFFELIASEIEANSETLGVYDVFKPCFDEMVEKIKENRSLVNPDIPNVLNLMQFFTRKSFLAEALVKFSTPTDKSNGKVYENTLFGLLLDVSCLPRSENGPFEFFSSVVRTPKQELEILENNIWIMTRNVTDKLFTVFYNILKLSPGCKHAMLSWIGNCLHANAGRAKLWSSQMMPQQMFSLMYAGDGFFINLCTVMLRLCQRFAKPCCPDLLKVQPTYCMSTVSSDEEAKNRGIHMICDPKETCLISIEDGQQGAVQVDQYNFITECFFMTHYCVHIGFHVLFERFTKLSRELHQLQTLYHEMMNSGAASSDPVRRVEQRFEKMMSSYLSMKAVLSNPHLLELSLNLNVATVTWLTHLAVCPDMNEFSEVTFPLPQLVPGPLSTVPEYIVTNVADLMLFTRKFRDQTFEVLGDQVNHVMTWILVFMGSPERMKNPHLRARLAQALEDLMPAGDETAMGSMGMLSNLHRDRMFTDHPLASFIGPVLLHVFVSIEMTGQSVEFEQKFNYRRPMYKILDFIWKHDVHKSAIKDLAIQAEEDIEATDSPLFLRFINLLMNDAIFLLDEALSYMQQIKEKQEEEDRGEVSELSAPQRAERESNLRQVSMLARFHNIQSRDTIHTLELLTQEITSIFTHSIMVDRIAAMLNYFLLHLVGPKKRNLKVKNFDEYEFKPQLLVSDICQLYLNLGGCEGFQLSIINDGRSYSKDLFPQAERVLEKINRPPEVRVAFAELAQRIQLVASRQQAEDEFMNDAPEEYLDPIMGTLMKDPVMLPSSKMTVDRSTIARHILSDQTDPFNRSPLTMDMVQSNKDVKAKIEMWLKTKREEMLSSSNTETDQ